VKLALIVIAFWFILAFIVTFLHWACKQPADPFEDQDDISWP
jgi:hypothetical protein